MAEILRNPTQEDLIKVIHICFRDWYYLLRKAEGYEWFDKPDITYFLGDSEAPQLNRVEKTLFSEDNANKRIEEIISDYKKRNRPFTWSINTGDTPRDLDLRLERAGLKLDDTTGMAVSLKDMRTPKRPEGFTVEMPKGIREIDAWARLMTDVYGIPDPEPFVKGVHVMSDCKDMFFYTGLLDGKPVATALNFMSNGVAWVNLIATIPSVRGRGIGSFITAKSLLDAKERGYEFSVLNSTKMGYNVYERLGFHEICKKVTYIWKPQIV